MRPADPRPAAPLGKPALTGAAQHAPDGIEGPSGHRAPAPPAQAARSTSIVGVGVVLIGLGTYVYLAFAARAMDVSHFARLSVVATAVITAGPGLFLPIEQEVSRGLAHRIAVAQSGRSLIRKAMEIGGLLAAVAALLVIALGLAGADRLLDGDMSLLVALACGIVSLLPAHLSRGVLAGSGHITRYAVQLSADGTLRAVGAAGLALAGVHTPWAYAALLTLAPLAAVGISVAGLAWADIAGRGAPAPATRRDLAPALGYLIGASFAMQTLANAGPTAVKLIAGTDSEQAGRFLAALVLARSPLFVVSALQATLVPAWAALVAHGELTLLRRRVGLAIGAMSLVGLAVVPVTILLGPVALRIIYGPDYALARHTLAALAAGTGLFCVALIASLALIAQARQSSVCAGWTLGVAVFISACFLPGDPADRVAIALAAGGIASFAWFVVAFGRRHPVRSSLGSHAEPKGRE